MYDCSLQNSPMTADQPLSSSSVSPLAAISLKLVGVVTVLSALLDYIMLLVPADFLNPQWQLSFTTQLVDRGIVPLVGIALLLTGFWVERMAGRMAGGSILFDLRFWSCALASLLGVIFLVLAFLHINNVRITSQEALAQVTREATAATTQLEERLTGEVSQQRNQLNLLFQDEALLDQAIQTGQLPEEVLRFKDDPGALDQFLSARSQEAQDRIQTEIGTRREQADKQVRREAAKSAIRISISGLLLAIGYTVIGWTGLRRLLMASR